MKVKLFEVRDRATFIPVIAVQLNPQNEAERYLLSRSGYGKTAAEHNRYILMADLRGSVINYDAFSWPNRTKQEAHLYLNEHFEELENGAVIDIEYILGEKQESKKSEANL